MKQIVAAVIVVLALAPPAPAQSQSQVQTQVQAQTQAQVQANGQAPAKDSPGKPHARSHRWRNLGAIAGAGGGFALGAMWGLGAFDDAVNAEQKIAVSAVVTSVGLGVVGYFIGRHADERGEGLAADRALEAGRAAVRQALAERGRDGARAPAGAHGQL